MKPKFSALSDGDITLHLIEDNNIATVEHLFSDYPDSDYMTGELHRSCRPKYDENDRRIKYGFYVTVHGKLAGLSLLGISSWDDLRGYTGADTIIQMRGQGIASRCKPALFFLAFELLGLNRVETGCVVSNTSSRRSIEKTKGLVFEGILRDFKRNPDGTFEDELRYAILRNDWQALYDKSKITIIK